MYQMTISAALTKYQVPSTPAYRVLWRNGYTRKSRLGNTYVVAGHHVKSPLKKPRRARLTLKMSTSTALTKSMTQRRSELRLGDRLVWRRPCMRTTREGMTYAVVGHHMCLRGRTDARKIKWRAILHHPTAPESP